MQGSSKKEVSCKTLITVFNAARAKNIDQNELLDGVPYDLSYLLNKHERIEWNNWVKIYANARKYFTPAEFEQMGREFVNSGSYVEGLLWAFILFSSNKISRFITKQLFRIGDKDFNCIEHSVEYRGLNNVIVTAHLDDIHHFSPEFFYIAIGVWKQLGEQQIGHKDFKVEVKWIHQGAIFNASWKKESYYFKFKKWIRWLFNFKNAMMDLADSHEELLKQYNQLEESRRLLQKQTTQLKTVHEISTSIKQSLNLSDTLKVITDTLVREAGFSAVFIELNKDLDDNEIDKRFQSGAVTEFVTPINQEVIINDKTIGVFKIYPSLKMDSTECNELLEYLSPVINIAIHDALVLRTITDYKDNLEQKVADRTSELEIAHDNLANSNKLLKEAQQTQNQFFTNISHEFRTPLTLILGPAKQILEQSKNDKIKEKAKLIHRSAKKLNRLANQLLDISRIEAGKMKLQTRPQNLISIIKDMVSSFQTFAERKNISLKFNHQKENIILYLDRDKIDKIFSNILSNAIKFTPLGGSVDIEIKYTSYPSLSKDELKRGFAEISVKDTGIGIPKEQINKIFDRFYQVDNRLSKEYEGTGVGLSLTKELVELHKGKIFVESEEGRGSIFKLDFPLGKEHLLEEEIIDEIQSDEVKEITKHRDNIIFDEHLATSIIGNKFKINSAKKDYPSLLIIEDNMDVRNYICGILSDFYKITEAVDGEEGLSKSFELIPDLIISDIMMPKMDGYLLCNNLKTDSRTSHIPIILLTAKATMKDKINGLEIGADDYIMKPFEANELKARIKNILEQRKRIHEYFKRHGLFEIEEKKYTSIDQKFLQQAFKIINEHISDPSFSIENFAENLAISRSLLHKKLLALAGETPGDLIRRIRLNKAAKLIECNSDNITEIAFDVGFNDHSYFTACFRKQFGVSPSQYHKNHIHN